MKNFILVNVLVIQMLLIPFRMNNTAHNIENDIQAEKPIEDLETKPVYSLTEITERQKLSGEIVSRRIKNDTKLVDIDTNKQIINPNLNEFSIEFDPTIWEIVENVEPKTELSGARFRMDIKLKFIPTGEILRIDLYIPWAIGYSGPTICSISDDIKTIKEGIYRRKDADTTLSYTSRISIPTDATWDRLFTTPNSWVTDGNFRDPLDKSEYYYCNLVGPSFYTKSTINPRYHSTDDLSFGLAGAGSLGSSNIIFDIYALYTENTLSADFIDASDLVVQSLEF